MKMYHETRKIMHSNIQVSATCVRAGDALPFQAIWVETERPISIEEAQEAFRNANGVEFIDDPAQKVPHAHRAIG